MYSFSIKMPDHLRISDHSQFLMNVNNRITDKGVMLQCHFAHIPYTFEFVSYKELTDQQKFALGCLVGYCIRITKNTF